MANQGILIVQDDFLLAEGLRTVVEGAGYDVVGMAKDTAGADRLAKQHRPVLAIVDMKLEIDVDGIATASVLKQRYDLKILITTGFPESFMESHGVDDLACAVLRKPYSDEEVLHAVGRCLEGGAARP